MSTSGRGRGRISNLPPLRRPGQPVNSPDYILTMLAVSESSDEVDMVNYVIGQVTAACSSPASTQEVVNIIYRMSMNDCKFGRVGAKVLARLVQLDHNWSKTAVLDKLQVAFNERERMRSGDGAELLNFVCFLGMFFNVAASCTGGDPVPLAEALITCLHLVLRPTLSGVELFTEQILLNGHKLLHHAPGRLAKLMIQARKLLIGQPPLGSVAATCIALCIDLEANNFSSLPDRLISLYISSLPPNHSSVIKKISSLRKRGYTCDIGSYACARGSRTKRFEENSLDLLTKRKWSSVQKYAWF